MNKMKSIVRHLIRDIIVQANLSRIIFQQVSVDYLEGFEFPAAKAEYLLTRTAQPGQGGDKQNFWQRILGFTSASDIRTSILSAVSIHILKFQGTNAYGRRFEASIPITGPNGTTRQVRTAWIVLEGERIARFITAYPDRKRRQR